MIRLKITHPASCEGALIEVATRPRMNEGNSVEPSNSMPNQLSQLWRSGQSGNRVKSCYIQIGGGNGLINCRNTLTGSRALQ